MKEGPGDELGAVRTWAIEGTLWLCQLLSLQGAGTGRGKRAGVEATPSLGPNWAEGNDSVWKQREGRRAAPASPALAVAERRYWETKHWIQPCMPVLARAAE